MQQNEQPTRLEGVVQKGWGYELIWATNEKYCGKNNRTPNYEFCSGFCFYFKYRKASWTS